ncbi:T9SS type A sorting domain-containing protein [Flavobacterium sp. NRK1]|uniref:T9SS type A sorting domain-containing protein n=1 Tax=Flavobacterium sp. NRK1 TaxID=2954929 RepID=UPI00209337B3|nr:T9SS type A sorting domain-containing protein [Flavobacterium sp. NRK1]MCO6147950.1 T9SS type A sorting domain-containing protein [Flavobacterium sp. NRK1]
MKKIILAAALFLSAFAQAQVIEVYDNDIQLENEGVYTYTTTGEQAKMHFQIINVSDATINIKLKMIETGNNDDGSNVQFCFGPNCYFDAPNGTTAPAQLTGITVAPQQDAGPTNYFYNSETVADVAGQPITYKLGIIQVDAAGDEIGEPLITFTYKYDPAATTSDFASLQRMGISINNTIVKNTLDITTNLNAKLQIVNINGQIIKNVDVTTGSQSIDLSTVAAGVYFAKFTTVENKTAQIKIVKN